MDANRHLTAAAVTILVCLALTLAGCSDGDRAARGLADRPARGGTLVLGGHMDLQTANPLAVNQAYPMEIQQHVLLMTLVRMDEHLQPVPYLASSWEVEGDTVVTFHIRDDVRWHDGVRTTAYDVAFTYERATDPETAFANRTEYFGHWREHEVVDSFTIRFRLEPHSEYLTGWAQMAIAPRHLLEDVPPAQLAQSPFGRNPVGNGPFRFVSYHANDRWVFEANPDFPQELGGRPNVDRLVWRVIPETATRVAALRTGAAHLITNPPREEAASFAADPRLRLVERPSRIISFIGWNGLRPPFDDPRVRRALTMAIDRQGIIDGLRAGFGTLALGPVGPYHWAFADTLDPVPHDSDAARALLLEAGFSEGRDGALLAPDGRPFSFALSVVAGDQFNVDAAEKIRGDLSRIGVTMRTQPLEGVTFFQYISSPERRFDAALLAFEIGARLDLRSQFHTEALGGGFQLASYSNAHVDSLLTQANVAGDRDMARPLWHRFQRIMLEEQPWTFLYYSPELFVVDERLRDVEMDIRGRFVSLSRWWLADGG